MTQPENRYYLTGFTGSSGYVVVSAERAVLLTDFRYVDQAREQAPLYDVVQHGAPYLPTLAEVLQAGKVRRLAFEADHVSVTDRAKLGQALAGVELVPTSALVERLRMVKEPAEIARIEAAVACADRAFASLLASGLLSPGTSEQAIAARLEYEMRLGGASRAAFETIVASGPRSALPHGRASGRTLEGGDLVTLDFGAVVDGYCSDITRTLVIGSATDEQRRVYDLVLQAQLAGVAAVRRGAGGKAVDAAARELIAAAGYGDYFGHGLGHGVGLAVHEGPRLALTSENVLEAGMVTSVEPGIYIPGWGGVRIEDLVVVTGEGCWILTRTPKELIEL